MSNDNVVQFMQRLQEKRSIYFRLYNALYIINLEEGELSIHQDGVMVQYTYPSLDSLFQEYIVYGLPLIDSIDDIKIV